MMIGSKSNIRNDFQSNMNGTILQSQRFHAYLESINQIGQLSIINPMAQPLHTNYKSNISEYRSQLHHPSDMNRITFPSIVEAHEEENQRNKKIKFTFSITINTWIRSQSIKIII